MENGLRVRTLTNSVGRANAFGSRVEARLFHFDEPDKLTDSLRDVAVLYNTYWVRFNYRDFSHTVAVENTRRLFRAAVEAGVRRVVHVSITNPSEDSALEYFRGKAVLERALIESKLSYAILRPAVLFGREDVLINNIAWTLRRFPIFGVFGDGHYRLRPIHVDDFAQLAVVQGLALTDVIIDAVGPEAYAYVDLVREIGAAIAKPRPIIAVPPGLGYAVAWGLGKLVGDVMLTRDEIKGLMADLLWTPAPAAGATKLSEWARANASTLGRRYASEVARRVNRVSAYEQL